MSKDHERLPGTSEAFIYVGMTRLMVRRLARVEGFQTGSLGDRRLYGVKGSSKL